MNPSRHTKSGTFARRTNPYTEANLAKEPASFPRFLDNPYFYGQHTFNLTHQDEGRTYNMSIAKMQADTAYFNSSNSIQL